MQNARSQALQENKAKTLPTRLEKDIQKAIIDRIENEFPLVAWVMAVNPGHTVYGTKSVMPGTSDIIGQMNDGRFLAIEVKRPGMKMTSIQREFIETVNKNGGIGFVCDDESKLESLFSSRFN